MDWSNDAENSALHHRNKSNLKCYFTILMFNCIFLIKQLQIW